MFSFTKALLAVSAIAAVLTPTIAQVTGNQTEAQLQQRRIAVCAQSIETPDFNNVITLDVSDTTQFTRRYIYDYERES